MVYIGDVKLMFSYGGRIDVSNNKLSYVGCTTKLLYVGRYISFSDMLNELVEACNGCVRDFKYQEPHGVILITVNNEKDLKNMMREYSRLCVSMDTTTPPVIRIFF